MAALPKPSPPEPTEPYEPCREHRQAMVPYLDDELTAGERRSLEEHVASCGDCQRVLESHRRVAALLQAGLRESERVLALPELKGLPDRVRAAAMSGEPVASADRVVGGQPTFLQAAAAVAAVALVAVGLWSFMVSDPDPRLGPNKAATQVADSSVGIDADAVADSDASAPVDDDVLASLEVLEAFHAEGIEPSGELVQLILDADEGGIEEDVVQEVFKYMLEEEILSEKL